MPQTAFIEDLEYIPPEERVAVPEPPVVPPKPSVGNIPFVPDSIEDLFAGIGNTISSVTGDILAIPQILAPGPVNSEEKLFGFLKSAKEIGRVRKFFKEAAALPAPSGTSRELTEAFKKDPLDLLNWAAGTVGEASPIIAAFAGAGLVFGSAPLLITAGTLAILHAANSYVTSIEEGYTEDEAAMLAGAMGLTQAVSDRLMISRLGGRLVARPMKEAIAKGLISSGAVKATREVFKQGAKGAAFETLFFSGLGVGKETADIMARHLITNEKIPDDILARIFNSGAASGLVGNVFGGGSSIIGAKRAVARARAGGREARATDFAPTKIEKGLEGAFEDGKPLSVPKPGDRYTTKKGEFEVLEVKPEALEGEGTVKVRVTEGGKTREADFVTSSFEKAVEGAKKISIETEGLSYTGAVKALNARQEGLAREVRDTIEAGAGRAEVVELLVKEAKFSPAEAQRYTDSIAKVVTKVIDLKVDMPREVSKAKEATVDPESAREVDNVKSAPRPARAEENLERALGGILRSGMMGDISKALRAGMSADSIANKLGVVGLTRDARARAVSFIAEKLKSRRAIPERFAIEGMNVPSTKGMEELNSLGLLSRSAELLQEGHFPVDISRSFRDTYLLDISEKKLTRRIQELEENLEGQLPQFQKGDFSSVPVPQAGGRNVNQGVTVRAQDVLSILEGPGYSVFASPNSLTRQGRTIEVATIDAGGKAKTELVAFPQDMIVPVAVSVMGKDFVTAKKRVQEYFSDFRQDSIKSLPPIVEDVPTGLVRAGRFDMFGTRVDTFASTSREAQTTKIRLFQPGKSVHLSELKKRNPEDPDAVHIFVKRPIKNLQGFIIQKVAFEDVLGRSVSSTIQDPFAVRRTAAGSEIKVLGAEKIYEDFVRGKGHVERALNATAFEIERVRNVLSNSNKLTVEERQMLKDGIFSTGSLIDPTTFGITIPTNTFIGRLVGTQSSVYVNPLLVTHFKEAFSIHPRVITARTIGTIIHELAHVPNTEAAHGPEFVKRLASFTSALGQKEISNMKRNLEKEYDDGSGRIHKEIATSIQRLSEEGRRQLRQRAADASKVTFAERSSSFRGFKEPVGEGVQQDGTRAFWRERTGIDGIEKLNDVYEDHLREVYKGGPPSDISVDFKDFAESRGFDRDLVDGGSPELSREGLMVKDAFREVMKSELRAERSIEGDIDKTNWAQRRITGLYQFAQAAKNVVEVQDYLRAHIDENTFRQIFAEDVNKNIIKRNNLGPDQSGKLFLFELERSNESFKLGRKLTREENEKLARKIGVKAESLPVAEEFERITERGLEELRTEMEADAGRNLEGEDLAKRMKGIEDDFGAFSDRNYMSMKRFGKYWVMVEGPASEKGRRKVLTAEPFEVEREQRARAKSIGKEFPEGSRITTPIVDDSAVALQGFPPVLLEAIKGKLNLSPENEAQLRNLMVSMNPGNSFIKSMLKRRGGIPGFSRDGPRVVVDYVSSMASHIANFRFQRRYDETILSLSKRVDKLQKEPGTRDEALKLRKILQVLESHNEFSQNPGNDLAQLRGGLFKYFLVYSPRTIATQVTQVWAYTFPELNARRGSVSTARVVAEINKAYVKTWKTFDLANPNHFDHLSKNLRVDESNMLTTLYREGNLTDGLAKMLAGQHGLSVLGRVSTKLKVVDKFIEDFGDFGLEGFQGGEELNRRVATLAAYNVGLLGGMRFDDAVTFARSINNNSNFVYAPYNRIPLARGGEGLNSLRAMIFLLKSFNVNSTHFQLASAGRTQFTMQMLAIGGIRNGIPGAVIALALYDLITSVADEGQKPAVEQIKDATVKGQAIVRKHLPDWLPELGASPSMMLDGLAHNSFGLPMLFRMFGGNFPEFNMAPSLGVGDTIPGVEPWLRFLARKTSFQSAFTESTIDIAGPGGSLAASAARASVDGGPRATFSRQALPPAVRNLVRAYMLVKEGGHVRRDGISKIPFDVHDPMQMAEIVGSALGFMPSIISEDSEHNFTQIEYEHFISALKEVLYTQYSVAHATGQPLGEISKKIKQLNKGLPPNLRIKDSDLVRALSQRSRNVELRDLGLPRSERFTPGPAAIEHQRKLGAR